MPRVPTPDAATHDAPGPAAPSEPALDPAPRSILRVPEVLAACARSPEGATMAEISAQIAMPRTSLYRIMRVLEKGEYLQRSGASYIIGPRGQHLGNLIVRNSPGEEFPQCARPVMEWLAEESGESVTLGTIMPDLTTVAFIESIASTAMLRYTVPAGDRRPIFRSASGKAMLAFLSKEAQRNYIAQTDFDAATPFTTRREDMPALLDAAARDGWVHDRNGNVEGASALAGAIFNWKGEAFAAISVAGPTERMDADIVRLRALVSGAAEKISRKLGYHGPLPPRREAS